MDTSIIRKLTDLNEMARHSRISLESKTIIDSFRTPPNRNYLNWILFKSMQHLGYTLKFNILGWIHNIWYMIYDISTIDIIY